MKLLKGLAAAVAAVAAGLALMHAAQYAADRTGGLSWQPASAGDALFQIPR